MRETVFYRPAGIAPIPDVVQRVRHYSGKVEVCFRNYDGGF